MAQGVPPEHFDCVKTLFFDETNNAKKFHLKDDDRLNVPVGVRFVLGGISCGNGLGQEELNNTLALQKSSKELKFDQIYGHADWNDFTPVLRSSRLTKYLSLLEDKGALIHFSSVNLFYFALVDIIDSLDFNVAYAFALKSILYQVAQRDSDAFVGLFRQHTYPDVRDVDGFLKALSNIVTRSSIEDTYGKGALLQVIQKNMGRKELTFIQDEQQNMYIKDFLPFYQEPLWKFANSQIVLDNEVDMMAGLLKWPVEVNGKKVDYSFVDSQTEPWVQMSDVAVSLVARYLCFVDTDDYKEQIGSFTERQMDNFKQLNRILAASEKGNKLFWHFTEDIRIIRRFSDCVKEYQ